MHIFLSLTTFHGDWLLQEITKLATYISSGYFFTPSPIISPRTPNLFWTDCAFYVLNLAGLCSCWIWWCWKRMCSESEVLRSTGFDYWDWSNQCSPSCNGRCVFVTTVCAPAGLMVTLQIHVCWCVCLSVHPSQPTAHAQLCHFEISPWSPSPRFQPSVLRTIQRDGQCHNKPLSAMKRWHGSAIALPFL